MKSVPIWVKFPKLPFKYLSEKNLFRIAGIIRSALKIDQATKAKDKLIFDRVMIEVGMQQQLPDVVEFCNEHGLLVTQMVEYEWKPVKCGKCKGFGHEDIQCKRNTGRKIWVWT